jgi:folate-dependent phosphoribosylglycinamide formyltransferase PurN
MNDANIVLWIKNNPNQIALANKIHIKKKLSGIVIEKHKTIKRPTLKRLITSLLDQTIFIIITNAWGSLQKKYQSEFPSLPAVATLSTYNINSKEVIGFTMSKKPTLIAISGTSLIKKKYIYELQKAKIINLHTGLSPYFNGGPNCTNWCIAKNSIEYIGSTIMWLDAGIDSGSIIKSELTPLKGGETLKKIHYKVMEHAHKIYVETILEVIQDYFIESVEQGKIGRAETYYSKQWNSIEKVMLLFNLFKHHLLNFNHTLPRKKIKTVDFTYSKEIE